MAAKKKAPAAKKPKAKKMKTYKYTHTRTPRAGNGFRDLFLRELLADPTMNVEQAAIRAGSTSKSPSSAVRGLLMDPKVKKQILKMQKERAKRLEISADNVLRELAYLAFFDVRSLYEEDGSLKKIKDLPEEVSRAIAAIEVQSSSIGKGGDTIFYTTRKVKLADKLKALELVGKHLKLFSDVHEHTGKDGEPLFNNPEMTDLELARRLAFLLSKPLREQERAAG